MDNVRKLQGTGGENIDRKLFHELLSLPHNLIYRYDLASDRFTYVSQSVESFIGISPQVLLSESSSFFLSYLHPNDKTRIAKSLRQLKEAAAPAQALTLDYRLRHMAGHDEWVSDSITLVRSEAEYVLIGNARKVPWVKLQDQCMQSKELLCQYLPFPYFRSQISDGKLLACNDVLWKVLKYRSRQECLRDCYLSKYYPAATRQQLVARLLKDGYLDRVEVESTFEGKPCWVEVSARYFPEQGCLEGISRDISPLKLLTPAEKSVLELVLNGLCNKEIAKALSRSVRTIEDHRAHIMQKLSAQNLIDLARKTYFLTVQP